MMKKYVLLLVLSCLSLFAMASPIDELTPDRAVMAQALTAPTAHDDVRAAAILYAQPDITVRSDATGFDGIGGAKLSLGEVIYLTVFCSFLAVYLVAALFGKSFMRWLAARERTAEHARWLKQDRDPSPSASVHPSFRTSNG